MKFSMKQKIAVQVRKLHFSKRALESSFAKINSKIIYWSYGSHICTCPSFDALEACTYVVGKPTTEHRGEIEISKSSKAATRYCKVTDGLMVSWCNYY